jgi:hypothetical protein
MCCIDRLNRQDLSGVRPYKLVYDDHNLGFGNGLRLFLTLMLSDYGLKKEIYRYRGECKKNQEGSHKERFVVRSSQLIPSDLVFQLKVDCKVSQNYHDHYLQRDYQRVRLVTLANELEREL